jgi:hypothetical protein
MQVRLKPGIGAWGFPNGGILLCLPVVVVVQITQRRARHWLFAHRRILIRGSSHKTSHNLQMPFWLTVRITLNCTASRRRWQASHRGKTFLGARVSCQ